VAPVVRCGCPEKNKGPHQIGFWCAGRDGSVGTDSILKIPTIYCRAISRSLTEVIHDEKALSDTLRPVLFYIVHYYRRKTPTPASFFAPTSVWSTLREIAREWKVPDEIPSSCKKEMDELLSLQNSRHAAQLRAHNHPAARRSRSLLWSHGSTRLGVCSGLSESAVASAVVAKMDDLRNALHRDDSSNAVMPATDAADAAERERNRIALADAQAATATAEAKVVGAGAKAKVAEAKAVEAQAAAAAEAKAALASAEKLAAAEMRATRAEVTVETTVALYSGQIQSLSAQLADANKEARASWQAGFAAGQQALRSAFGGGSG
jgi:hypothetical protein